MKKNSISIIDNQCTLLKYIGIVILKSDLPKYGPNWVGVGQKGAKKTIELFRPERIPH